MMVYFVCFTFLPVLHKVNQLAGVEGFDRVFCRNGEGCVAPKPIT